MHNAAEAPNAELSLQWNACLRQHNSFGVAARARCLARAGSPEAICRVLDLADAQSLPLIVLGGGSNVLLLGDLEAVVLLPDLRGVEWRPSAPPQRCLRVAAGENWHALVGHTLEQGAFGLENLALIPGSVGAAPIQNIGAYGVELERYVEAVEVLDRDSRQVHRIASADCGFAYRDSRFKGADRERFVITAVDFALSSVPQPQLGYTALDAELAARGIHDPGPREVYAAVVAIRRRKLPDPATLGNAGSFFKNPLVSAAQADALRAQEPGVPVYSAAAGQFKIAAAWLIERCGWKGARAGDAGVHAEHALVLVNHGQASGAEIWTLARRIQDSVRERFGIDLEPEPRLLGG